VATEVGLALVDAGTSGGRRRILDGVGEVVVDVDVAFAVEELSADFVADGAGRLAAVGAAGGAE
jgi:hypothetical protein